MFVFLNNVSMVYFLLALLGLLVGSFISVVTYRIPRNLGFVKGRSFCDSCKTNLCWYDNIPLFSFLFYRGRARCCSEEISIRYPLIELSSAIGVLIVWILTQNIFCVALFFVTLTIFVIDLEHQIIPDNLTWLTLFLVLSTSSSLFSSLFSGFLFSFLILLIFIATRGRGMGLGDVKLAIPLGFYLGLEKGVTWLMVSFLTGGIIASILLISGRAKMKTKIAFGPFLIFAFWLTTLYA